MCCDHLINTVEVDFKRFFADDVYSGPSVINDGLIMETAGGCDGYDINRIVLKYLCITFTRFALVLFRQLHGFFVISSIDPGELSI